jgi:putative PIN family toxin of toxin-antitoxin system
VLAAVRRRELETVGSWALAEELASVLRRPKLRRYAISEDDARDLLILIARDLPEVDVTIELRDPRDAPVVAAAVAGRADAIVTGDRDLLDDGDLRRWLLARKVEVLAPAELVERLLRG